MNNILLTGGLGYIGSHIAVELLLQENNVIIIDNIQNSSIEMLEIIEKESNKKPIFYKEDMMNYECINNIFQKHKIDIVIHLAGLKSVNESIMNPIYYYQNNLSILFNLLQVMNNNNCKNIIFSSSSTVYGNSIPPYTENSQTGICITNPYGKTKYYQEEILKDLYKSNNNWNIIILRYFNPISSRNIKMKETPKGVPNNLFPYLMKVYNGEIDELKIFGNDYDTKDGTCSRDFIHVVDVAKGHVRVCDYIKENNKLFKIYNLGTGEGVTVKELINSFENVNNIKLNYRYVERREGDLDKSYGNVSLIQKELGWKTEYTLEDMVKIN
jgi:UDP-glucose 4-epimerase